MRRRRFITLLGGAAVAWPLAARAQQPAMPVIGYLHVASPEPYAPMIAAFLQGLSEVGYVEGKNVKIEFRWAEGRLDRLAPMATELVGQQVAVLVAAGGDDPAVAAKAATRDTPTLFTIGGDPVRYGLVSNLSRPDGNITGVTFFTVTLGPKRLEILRELVPSAATIALLSNSDRDAKEIEDAARPLGQKIRVLRVGSEQEIEPAFRSLAQAPADSLLIVSNPLFTNRREQIVALANFLRIPAAYSLREYVISGGLISYGASIKDAYRQTGIYAGRLLKGAKPSDLPVMQPTKFEMVVNLKTAKALGLTVPDKLIALADEVIE